jgi:hypothetical protein
VLCAPEASACKIYILHCKVKSEMLKVKSVVRYARWFNTQSRSLPPAAYSGIL